MDTLKQHELFEIDVLDRMRSFKLLDPLVFGGGTMLRLCHQLNRFSADLDFWFVKPFDEETYFSNFKHRFENTYEMTDAQIKHFTLLFELRSGSFPKKLKIEIRRGVQQLDFQDQIAFSRFASKQVVLKVITLEQAMQNKINAFMDRGEVRDGFDIEFLLRKGINLPEMSADRVNKFTEKLSQLKEMDFKVKLGSILEKDIREYYIVQKFAFLEEAVMNSHLDHT